MNYYSNPMGIDMIAVALQLKKMGKLERAKKFLKSVVSDFTGFVQEIDERLTQNDIVDEDFAIIESSIQALEGLISLYQF